MSDIDETDIEGLRAWARGMLTLEAGTEMLIRAGYAQSWRPWVREDTGRQRHWIDFESIPDLSLGMSGGQQRFLRLAASLAGDVPIMMGDDLTGIDSAHAGYVLDAIAHVTQVFRG